MMLTLKKTISTLGLVTLLSGCAWWQAQYENGDGLPAIRSQADVDAYNATVSSESEKLICDREAVIGSNVRRWVCMTVEQRDRLARESQDIIRDLDTGVLR